MADPVTVVLVDDHEIVRRGVRDLLDADPTIEVIGEASTYAEAMARIPALRPVVAVLDVRLSDGNGVELCRELRAAMPELRVLILTSFSDDEALFDAIMAGAAGYVLKQIKGDELLHAVQAVGAGQSLLDPTLTARVLERLRHPPTEDPRLAALTEQERKILELIAEGLTNREIGERMFLAEKTVRNYVSSVLGKLGMARRTQAAVYAASLAERKDIRPPG